MARNLKKYFPSKADKRTSGVGNWLKLLYWKKYGRKKYLRKYIKIICVYPNTIEQK